MRKINKSLITVLALCGLSNSVVPELPTHQIDIQNIVDLDTHHVESACDEAVDMIRGIARETLCPNDIHMDDVYQILYWTHNKEFRRLINSDNGESADKYLYHIAQAYFRNFSQTYKANIHYADYYNPTIRITAALLPDVLIKAMLESVREELGEDIGRLGCDFPLEEYIGRISGPLGDERNETLFNETAYNEILFNETACYFMRAVTQDKIPMIIIRMKNRIDSFLQRTQSFLQESQEVEIRPLVTGRDLFRDCIDDMNDIQQLHISVPDLPLIIDPEYQRPTEDK